ncbi:ATP-dependent nuclease [Peribacillus frigoritolerans]|uniref:ATP-dependent nuclease n=1 Tax=Peribacillus frigoritolerans TaxID=450367 RepID=UPI00215AFB68|nr:AAA family ATPase [Peribacillus frigoritolerans]MCR8870523.1 AAA family ATPase [Peribacillus frigoritolerans]
MKLNALSVKNFKSISKLNMLKFHEKFTILAGRNNSGKTALLEVIAKGVHSQLTKSQLDLNNKYTTLELVLSLSYEDKKFLFLDNSPRVPNRLIVTLEIERNYARIVNVNELDERDQEVLVAGNIDGDFKVEEGYSIANKRFKLPDEKIVESQEIFYKWIQDNIIFISAQRNSAPSLSTTPNENLDLDASNLHTVLYTLRNNQSVIFDKIQNTFSKVFPEVKGINTVVEMKNSSLITNIMLEFEDSKERIKLQDCGSGYTQILIMLCLIHSENEKIILFDEPHTYLHPYAEKAIYDLAEKNDKHQYIFSTHSPLLINYPVEKSTYFVQKKSGHSEYLKIDNIQELLKDIGAANSNYAFADRVIFVEGQTEEKILPIIFKENNFEQIGYNYTIINVKGTGDEFSSQKAMGNYSKQLEKIFNSISDSPIPYKILIDRDEKNKDALKKLVNTYGNKIIVLPRREIENYFLIPEAIEALIKNILPNQIVTADIIKQGIENCLNNRECRDLYPKGCEDPIKDVKGSLVLKQILEPYHIEYSKANHGLFITEWLYANNNKQLDDIYNFFKDFLED